MKLKYLFIGSIIGFGGLTACEDQLNYQEYSTLDKGYISESYLNVGGLVTNIYAQLDSDWGNYGGATLASACDEAEVIQFHLLGQRIMRLSSNVTCSWKIFWV